MNTPIDVLVVGVNVACWGAIVVVWMAAWIRDRTSTTASIRRSTDVVMAPLAAVAVAAIVLVGPRVLAPLTVDAAWIRLIGGVVLLASTTFAIRARLTLGRAWSVGPQASTALGLRTDGPYAITRHPIYTGLLGMMVGTALTGGLGQWLTLLAAGLVVAAFKIRSEERLLLATFPEAYRAYRGRVPMLIPRSPSPSAVGRHLFR
jgi:protein-S-isoprenylcysteine O-methyltransferase Ste14